MFYYLYQITNLVNNKIYVGIHKTNDMSDGYMGSGKVIKRAIEKHGIDNFQKVILETFENSEAMYACEKEIVTEEFLSRNDVYNLRRGGYGGFDYINDTSKNLYGKNGQPGYGGENLHKSITVKRMKQQGRYLEYVNKISNTLIEKHASGEIVSSFTKNNPMYNPELKQKQKEALQKINHQQGNSNSQYGTYWVTHKDLGNKKIKKEMLNEYISLGYTKGRVLNAGEPI